jgi:hypothetical protein
MSRVIAIFDVDQTLVQGNTERFFFRFLVQQRLISMTQAYLSRRLAAVPRDVSG